MPALMASPTHESSDSYSDMRASPFSPLTNFPRRLLERRSTTPMKATKPGYSGRPSGSSNFLLACIIVLQLAILKFVAHVTLTGQQTIGIPTSAASILTGSRFTSAAFQNAPNAPLSPVKITGIQELLQRKKNSTKPLRILQITAAIDGPMVSRLAFIYRLH